MRVIKKLKIDHFYKPTKNYFKKTTNLNKN